ncbi:MAG TPA: hypothetical protein PLF31_00530 [Candidatus Paceibacterota bacterium]|nr:hypothetical protein [Candidatus Paceibacterota bacterium]
MRKKQIAPLTSTRPTIETSCPGIGLMRYAYTEEKERSDISTIEEARKNGNVCKDALHLYSNLQRTAAHLKICFTEEEAQGMELKFHLQEMCNASTTHHLLSECAEVCQGAIPNQLRADEWAQWHPYRSRTFLLPDKKKLSLLGETESSVRQKFLDCIAGISEALVRKLRNNFEKEDCTDILTSLKEAIMISGKGWSSFGITPAEAIDLTQKSIMFTTKRLVQNACAKKNLADLLKALNLRKEWGFSWSDIGITPQEAYRVITDMYIRSLEIPELIEELQLLPRL